MRKVSSNGECETSVTVVTFSGLSLGNVVSYYVKNSVKAERDCL